MSPYVMPGVKYVRSVTTPQYIVTRILDHFEMTLDQVRVKRRDRKYITVRAILCWYLYHKCRWSLQNVADYLSPAITNHTTVINALKLVQNQLSLGHDNEIAEHIKNIGL